MKISAALACFVLAIVASLVSQTFAETEQTAARLCLTRGPTCGWRQRALARLPTATSNTGWKVVSKESPINSIQGLPILPATSNVSGTAMLDQIGGGRDLVQYEVKFITAGTYQLFTRHSMYDSATVAGNSAMKTQSICRPRSIRTRAPIGLASKAWTSMKMTSPGMWTSLTQATPSTRMVLSRHRRL